MDSPNVHGAASASSAPSPRTPTTAASATTQGTASRTASARITSLRRSLAPVRVRPSLGEGVGARDDLEDLLRDLGLARPVHVERPAISSPAFFEAFRMAVMRAPCSGGRLEQGAVDGRLEVGGQQAAEDLLRARLVDEVALEGDLVGALLLLLEQRARDREDVLDETVCVSGET